MKNPALRIVVYVIAAVILAGAVLLPGWNRTYVEGDRLSFSLPNLEGEVIGPESEELRGKVLLINLWGTWCPPCRYEIPYLVKLQEEYGARGFEVVGIEYAMYAPEDPAERAESLTKFAESLGMNYTILMGTQGEQSVVSEDLPALRNFLSFPTSIFIRRDGTVAKVQQGFYEGDMPRYRALIEHLLGDEPIPETGDAAV